MNAGDLMAKLEANKKPLAIAGAAGVAGLALLQRKKAGGDVGGSVGAAPVGAGSGSTLAAPNGQVVYSSEASNVYNALQGPLATVSAGVSQLLAEKSAAAADTTIPIASRLFNPNMTGNYVTQKTGEVAELQSDGSLFWLNPTQWASIVKASGGTATPMDVGSFGGAKLYETKTNLAAANSKFTA